MQDKEELTTMVKVLESLRKEGFTTDFKVAEDGYLSSLHDEAKFRPEQLKIVNFYRFEGETNPDDMAILYVIETDTGLKGTISDAYGTYYDATVVNFMRQVEDLGKDVDKHTGSHS